MSGAALLPSLTGLLLALGPPVLLALVFIDAPYGRFSRGGFGPLIPARVGWFTMEWPSVLWVPALYALGPYRAEWTALGLLGLYELHYLPRTLLDPLLRAPGRPMPLGIALGGMASQLLSGAVIALSLSHVPPPPASWLLGPAGLFGVALFLLGLAANRWADVRLFALRRQTPAGSYAIPRGGLFELVSCPNYLGELVAWLGFALASGALGPLAFALFSVANLAPRARAHHRFYRERFPEYPARRRALVPFVY